MNSNKNCFTRCQYVFPSSGRTCNKDIRYCCKNKHRMCNIELELQEMASIKLIGIRHPCRALVKGQKGKVYDKCGRVNCKFHNRISDILNLPDIFCQYEIDYHTIPTIDQLIEMYENAHEHFSPEYGDILKTFLLNLIDMFSHCKLPIKFLSIAYIYHLIDTPCGRATFDKNSRFRFTCIEKLKYILESEEISNEIRANHHEFFSYMRDTFAGPK